MFVFVVFFLKNLVSRTRGWILLVLGSRTWWITRLFNESGCQGEQKHQLCFKNPRCCDHRRQPHPADKKTPFKVVTDLKAKVAAASLFIHAVTVPHFNAIMTSFLITGRIGCYRSCCCCCCFCCCFFSMNLTQCLPKITRPSLSLCLTRTHTCIHTNIHTHTPAPAPSAPLTRHQRSFFSKLQSILPQAFPTDWPQ